MNDGVGARMMGNGLRYGERKLTKKKLAKSSIKMVTPNKYTALATYIEETPSPPEQFPNDERTLAKQTRQKKRPTQKHVRHTLWLLAQQESAFLERSITRAENEAAELAKRDKTNKQRMSIDKNHQLPNHQLEWKQKAKNASQNITGSIYRALKLAKTSFTKTKTVSFATTRQVRIFQDKEIAAMITYDSGADGHYLSERDQINVGLEVANGGTSTARHVICLPFKQLSNRAASADSF
jgi:beta-galactosidase/beta-glucuronidase